MNPADIFFACILGGVLVWAAELLGLWEVWQKWVETKLVELKDRWWDWL